MFPLTINHLLSEYVKLYWSSKNSISVKLRPVYLNQSTFLGESCYGSYWQMLKKEQSTLLASATKK